MNKNILLILTFILSLLIINFSSAYNLNNLMHYYSMDDTSSNKSMLYDNRINANLYYSGVLNDSIFVNGVKETALKFTATGVNDNKWFNNTVPSLTSFSINMWLKATAVTNSQVYYVFGNSTCSLSYVGNNPTSASYTNCFALRPYVTGVSFVSGAGTTYLIAPLQSTVSYSMVTLIYNATSKNLSYYSNGAYKNSSNVTISPITKFNLGDSINDYFDELSIWNTALAQSDLVELYHQGYGYDYNQTVDNVGKVYEQTFEYFDICIPGTLQGVQDLCHHLYYNSTNGAYCPFASTEQCVLGCKDNSTYWENIQSSPINRNYSGYCTVNYVGVAMCNNLNDIRCGNLSNIETCQLDAFGFTKWTTTSYCINNATCTNGVCYLPGESPIVNSNTDSIFANLSIETKYWIMLIASLGILVLFTILLAMYGAAATGAMIGLVLSIITSLTMTIIFNLSLLIPILYIIIGGAILAFLIRKTVVGQ